jgi:hypothetical protein
MKKIIFLEGVLLFFIYFLLSNFSTYEMSTLRLREDIIVVRDAGSINDYNSIFLIQTKDKGIIAVKEIQKINDNWIGHIQPLGNLIKDSFSFRSILNLYGDRDRIEKIYKEKEEYFIIFPNKEIYGLSLEEVKNQLDIEKIDFIDMNKYMNKNGEEKSLTIRYQIYLDKLSNYNYYDKEFELSEIKKVFIFKGTIILFLILTFFININYFIKCYFKKENFLSNKDLSNGDKVVIASTVLFFDFLVLIFCIFSSWYKNYVLENYIGLLFVFHLIFKNIIISFSFSEENRTKKILGNFFSSRILLYLLPILSLILVSNIEYKIPSIFYFLFYIYSIIIVGLELIKKVGFYKGNYYFSYYFIHQIVYILLLFWLYITF